ncbi:HAD hydrolase-like protein [Pedobacter glucosidilyticus]|uniref:HAD hydrolase-like protein n=1 Tax=Pedobacter glucosidilyticus TaxID=1122941 RepID=UPI00040A76FF|nr:HAD hydrolase-like protein [Pedobacter glucosidilyticus]
MINYKDLDAHKKAFIFELDDVLIPEKDYDLQVYYLFANFVEYLETFPPAQDMVDFAKKRYEIHGKDGMFKAIQETFGIALKYEENLNLLFTNARLPLKLLLYKEALELLQEIVVNRKELYILTSGNPVTQLNKITQTEWNGLEKYLKVYFVDEFEVKPSSTSLHFLLEENKLAKTDVIYFGKNALDQQFASHAGVAYQALVP